MRINGEWFICEDGITRPVMHGAIRTAQQVWKAVSFLVDTGADCTVFASSVVDSFDIDHLESEERLGAIGSVAPSVQIVTQISLPRDDGGRAIFRGEYSAFTQADVLDISILGRDNIDKFALVLDRDNEIVYLLRKPHRVFIEMA